MPLAADTRPAGGAAIGEVLLATAIGLVVLFGTLMIPLMPLLTGALGLDERTAGLWIGASTHEVAQVVAAVAVGGAGALLLP